MNELLQSAGLTKVAEDKIFVTQIKGPLEDGWQTKVEGFVHQLLTTSAGTPMNVSK
jgi:hypothetical protein